MRRILTTNIIRLTLAACACFACRATETNIAPVLKIGDRTFTNASIRKVNATTVIVRDASGFGSVAITNLPEPHRARFLDTNEVARMERERAHGEEVAARNAQRRAEFLRGKAADNREMDSLSRFSVRVDKVLPEGLLCTRVIKRFVYGEARGRFGPRPVIDTRREDGERLLITNFAEQAAEGKELYVVGLQTGTQKVAGHTVEVWDCGTYPRSSRR